MESSSSVRSVPPRKTLREGQLQVVKKALSKKSGLLSVQLPTGYGKTLTAASVFVKLREAGVVNRLLYLVPTTAQLRQFTDDGRSDFEDAGLAGISPFDIGYSPGQALARHRKNHTIVYVATIQAVIAGHVGIAIKEMIQTGQWMIVIDEYHHYGVDKAWARAVLDLNAAFTLAMSATPIRKGQDGAFGKPSIITKYVDAATKENAVKRLQLHSYEYRVDAITVNGEPISFTTSELIQEVGSTDPVANDKFVIGRKLRWSPKYISPLVSIPVERLLARRHRNFPLQMIVGAMGCLHAKMVCEQIHSMFGTLLRVDWVGTGPNGKSDADNEAILKKFCPPKRDGKRRPEDVGLDILVHVGMAGEGLDSVFVSEIIHLNPASITNQNDQENGRAARRIPGAPDDLQVAFINVDSSSPYAEWKGQLIMSVFDRENGEPPPPGGDDPPEPRDYSDIPDKPVVIIASCELDHIDKGDPEVRGCAEAIVKVMGLDISVLKDIKHEIYDHAITLRRRELAERAEGQEGMAALYQIRDQIRSAVGKVASLAARTASISRVEKSLPGDNMKRINSEIKKRFGGSVDDADENGLRERYAWVKRLETTIKTSGVPPWLL